MGAVNSISSELRLNIGPYEQAIRQAIALAEKMDSTLAGVGREGGRSLEKVDAGARQVTGSTRAMGESLHRVSTQGDLGGLNRDLDRVGANARQATGHLGGIPPALIRAERAGGVLLGQSRATGESLRLTGISGREAGVFTANGAERATREMRQLRTQTEATNTALRRQRTAGVGGGGTVPPVGGGDVVRNLLGPGNPAGAGSPLGKFFDLHPTLKQVSALSSGFFAAQFAVQAVTGAVRTLFHAVGSVVTRGSDLGEQLSKAQFAFGPGAASTIVRDADTISKKLGIVKTDFIESASTIGLIGKAAGLTSPEAAKLGSRFATLATDVSSFYNVPVDDALVAIRAGLVGETEPLRRFGVLVDDNAVKAYGFAHGLVSAGQELTQQQKTLIRTQLIQQGFADATGDLERTQGSLANRLRAIQGHAENYATALGVKVGPSVLGALDATYRWGQTLLETGKRLGPFAAGIGTAVGNVVHILQTGADAAAPFARAFLLLGGAALIGGLNLLGTALGSVTGYLADNETLVRALATALTIALLPALLRTSIALTGALVGGLLRAVGASRSLLVSLNAYRTAAGADVLLGIGGSAVRSAGMVGTLGTALRGVRTAIVGVGVTEGLATIGLTAGGAVPPVLTLSAALRGVAFALSKIVLPVAIGVGIGTLIGGRTEKRQQDRAERAAITDLNRYTPATGVVREQGDVDKLISRYERARTSYNNLIADQRKSEIRLPFGKAIHAPEFTLKLGGGDEGKAEKAADNAAAYRKELERLEPIIRREGITERTVMRETGISREQLFKAAKSLHLNLADADTGKVIGQITQKVRQLAAETGVTGNVLLDMFDGDVKAAEEFSKELDKVKEKVSSAFLGDLDINARIGKFEGFIPKAEIPDDVKLPGADKAESAQKRLNDAHLAAVRAVDAHQRAVDRLAAAQLRLAGAQAKGDQKGIAAATREVAAAQLDVAKSAGAADKATGAAGDRAVDAAKAASAALATTSVDVTENYRVMVFRAEEFASLTHQAIAAGLDPQFVARQLEAGPEAAIPVLKGILSGHVETNVALVNDSERRLREVNFQVVEQARLTALAVNSEDDFRSKHLADAMKIQQAVALLGTKATAQTISRETHIGVADVEEIMKKFGITLVGTAASVIKQLGPGGFAATNTIPQPGQGPRVPNPFSLTGAQGMIVDSGVQTFASGGLTGISGREASILTDVIVRRFGIGGQEDHQPQIATTGWPYRVWAEPEAGGWEAYIPGGMDRRGRAVSITAEVADRFGYELVPKGMMGYAHGGVVGLKVGPPTVNVTGPAPLALTAPGARVALASGAIVTTSAGGSARPAPSAGPTPDSSPAVLAARPAIRARPGAGEEKAFALGGTLVGAKAGARPAKAGVLPADASPVPAAAGTGVSHFAGGGLVSLTEILNRLPETPAALRQHGLLGTAATAAADNMRMGLAQKIKGESDKAALLRAAVAFGGPVKGGPGIGAGRIGSGWGEIVRYLSSKGVYYVTTSTTGGNHVRGSLHYQGKAVDLVGTGRSTMRNIFDTLLGVGSSLQELFYDPAGFYIKRGARVPGAIGGHSDHVHAATFARGGVLGRLARLVLPRQRIPEAEPVRAARDWLEHGPRGRPRAEAKLLGVEVPPAIRLAAERGTRASTGQQAMGLALELGGIVGNDDLSFASGGLFKPGVKLDPSQVEDRRAPVRWPYTLGHPLGLWVPGNVRLTGRKAARTPEGTLSIFRSRVFQDPAEQRGVFPWQRPAVVVPTVIAGKVAPDAAAFMWYRRSGQHLGKFLTPAQAARYSGALFGRFEEPLRTKPSARRPAPKAAPGRAEAARGPVGLARRFVATGGIVGRGGLASAPLRHPRHPGLGHPPGHAPARTALGHAPARDRAQVHRQRQAFAHLASGAIIQPRPDGFRGARAQVAAGRGSSTSSSVSTTIISVQTTIPIRSINAGELSAKKVVRLIHKTADLRDQRAAQIINARSRG